MSSEREARGVFGKGLEERQRELAGGLEDPPVENEGVLSTPFLRGPDFKRKGWSSSPIIFSENDPSLVSRTTEAGVERHSRLVVFFTSIPGENDPMFRIIFFSNGLKKSTT